MELIFCVFITKTVIDMNGKYDRITMVIFACNNGF